MREAWERIDATPEEIVDAGNPVVVLGHFRLRARDVMNSIKKYVVSNSLQVAEWQNSEIISGNVAQKLTDIKAQDGGDIAMSGSPTTVRWLLREGLLDELNLLVHPIVVGDGLARLFPPDEPSTPLKLMNAQTFQTGVLNLSYAPATD